jgi:UDP-N-acetylmuramate dehydrogenase
MKAVVDSFDLVDSAGNVSQHTMEDIHAGYRETDLLKGDRMLLRARFRLEEPGDSERIHQNTLEHLRERKSKQPLDKPTAGSTFRSPPGTKGAGWHIEQAGLKGFRIGDAMVSQKHANWIENLGKATAADIGLLINHIQNEVFKQSGIHLEPEVRILS